MRVTKITSKIGSHELTACLSVFDLFLTQWIMTISKGCTPDNFESKNSLKLSFTNICGLHSNLTECEFSLNQTLLKLLFYVRQTWMTHLILALSLWGVVFLKYERILLLTFMVLQFMWRKDFLLQETSLEKTVQILTYVFDWLYFTQYLTSFSSIDHLLHLYAQFFILFHLTMMRLSRSTNLLMCLSL